jgi:hypothetical protein
LALKTLLADMFKSVAATSTFSFPSASISTFDKICIELFLSAIVTVFAKEPRRHCFEIVISMGCAILSFSTDDLLYNESYIYLKDNNSFCEYVDNNPIKPYLKAFFGGCR